jgi:hypothetical protein
VRFLIGYRTYIASALIIVPQVATILGYDMTTEMIDGIKNVGAQIGDLIEAVALAMGALGIRGAILRRGTGE